jgi:hypothetical protein
MMAKTAKKTEIELRPDGWDRFKRAVSAAVKSGAEASASEKITSEGARETIVSQFEI